jgi:hypothetical protein
LVFGDDYEPLLGFSGNESARGFGAAGSAGSQHIRLREQMADIMQNNNEINKHSRVTISLAATILVFIVGLAVSGVAEYDSTRAQIAELQKSQWTVNDQLRWTFEMKDENPSLKVPIPQLPSMAAVQPESYLAQYNTNNSQ